MEFCEEVQKELPQSCCEHDCVKENDISQMEKGTCCISQCLNTYLRQFVKDEIADIRAVCVNCKYADTCNGEWHEHVSLILHSWGLVIGLEPSELPL